MSPALLAGFLVLLAVGRVAAHVMTELLDPSALRPGVDWTHSVSIWVVAALLTLVGSRAALSLPVLWLALPLLLLWVAPWPVVRTVLIPMGWMRASYHLTRHSPLTWRHDRAGGATFAAAWALLNQPTPRDEDLAWLDARLAEQAQVSAANLAARGVLALQRGDRTEARDFLGIVSMFDHRIVDDGLLRLTTEILVAEAAERGAWDEVVRATTTNPYTTPAVDVLRAIALRLEGAPDAPDDVAFAALLKRAPRGRRPPTALVERALQAAPPKPASPTQVGPTTPPTDQVAHALQCHLQLLTSPTRASLHAAARAWDEALPQLASTLMERASELGAHNQLAASIELRAQVEATLARAAEAQGLDLDQIEANGVLGDARSLRREDVLRTIELAASAMERRVEAEEWLSPVDEARAWLALGRLYLEGTQTGGDSVRHLTFRAVYQPLCTLSVDLYNRRQERWLSNAMTRWLLREARKAGDVAAIELQERNLQV